MAKTSFSLRPTTRRNSSPIASQNNQLKSKVVNGASLLNQIRRHLSFLLMRAPKYSKQKKCYWIQKLQLKFLETFTDNILIYLDYLISQDTRRITKNFYLLETMWIEGSRASKPQLCCQHIKLNSPKTSICLEVTTNASPLTECMDSMMSANEDTM